MSGVPEAISVFGMGSFFDDGPFRDVDLVIVVDAQGTALDRAARILRKAFQIDSQHKFDLTILTTGEFAERPLRDFNDLILLWQRTPTTAPS